MHNLTFNIKNRNIKYPKYLLIKAKMNVTHWTFWFISLKHALKKKINVFSIGIVNNLIIFFYKLKKLSFFKTHLIILQNIFLGMAEKYSISLELQGVGYTVIKQSNFLTFNLGFSHKLNYKIPLFIEIYIKKKLIEIKGCNFQKIKEFSSILRRYKSPEPYKGKGIRYQFENIVLKESKKSK